MSSKNFQILDMQPVENSCKCDDKKANAVVEVSGTSECLCKPDICVLNILIENVKSKAIEAKQAVLKRMLYAKQCISSFHIKSKNFSDYVSLTPTDTGFRCSGIIVLQLTDFKIGQEIGNLLVEKLEHAVRIEFKLERSEEALRLARQRASAGAVTDAKLKAQTIIGGGKLAVVSVRQVEEVERSLSTVGTNKDAAVFHWAAQIDEQSVAVQCRVQATFRSARD